jgi:hypothetical protein
MTGEKYRYGTTTAGLSSGRLVELLPDIRAINSSFADGPALSRRAVLLSTAAVVTGRLGRNCANDVQDSDIVVVNGWVLSRADLMSGIESGLLLAPFPAT